MLNDCTSRCTFCAQRKSPAFTLIESMVVIVVIGLLALMAMMDLFELFRKTTFKAQAEEFVSTMRAAANAAAESDRRYEVIIDMTEQSYTLRQITTPDLLDVLEEEIIVKNDFSDNCRAAYVLFDDLQSTDENHRIARFRAGHAGWQYGGKIVLLDKNEQPYSVLVNRANRIVALKEGDIEILLPKAKDEVPF